MNPSTETLTPPATPGESELAPSAPEVSPSARYEPCEQCGAPLDHKQRYCVNCAARRPDPSNPSTRYFAAASRRRARPAQARKAPDEATPMRGAAVMLLVLLPVAIAIGVLVGRSGDDAPDNSELIDALKASGAEAATGTELAADSSGAIPSSFGLEHGYAVQVSTLPASGADAAAVTSAEDEAEGKGADDVGVINPKDFKIAPDSGGDLVIYSGEFEAKGDAEKALKDLKGDFSDAKVIEVTAAGAGGGGGDKVGGSEADTPVHDVVKHTPYGDVHDVTKLQPSDEAGERGMEIAQEQANMTGEDYIESQRNLPDVIQVGP